MRIHRWQSKLEMPKPVALTIGNFDGVHLGHQAILSELIFQAQARELAPTLMSFFPHPKTVIRAQSANFISSLRDRAYWLNYYGLPDWVLLSFTHSLMRVAPEVFVTEYLLDKLSIKYLLVGDDFRFGYQGKGDIHLLRAMSDDYDFEVKSLDSICHQSSGKRISSSIIRQALASHDIKLAESYLGHGITYTARVRHGEKRGREIKTPTVNLHVSDHWCLPDGVYVVKVEIIASKRSVWGIANVGKTPTFAGKARKLEAYLFDGQYDLYGQMLRVEMKQFIRPMRQFADKEALQTQIQRDIISARETIAHFS